MRATSLNWQLALTPLRADVLVFVGPVLDPTVYYLSHSRLAPVQIAFWGGAGTTGLGEATMSTVDYFVAPAMILSSEAHRAYSEQLVRLPGAGSILPTEIESLPDDAGPDVLPGARKYDFGAFFLYSKYRYAAVIFDDISQLHPGMDNLLRGILRKMTLRRRTARKGIGPHDHESRIQADKPKR